MAGGETAKLNRGGRLHLYIPERAARAGGPSKLQVSELIRVSLKLCTNLSQIQVCIAICRAKRSVHAIVGFLVLYTRIENQRRLYAL